MPIANCQLPTSKLVAYWQLKKKAALKYFKGLSEDRGRAKLADKSLRISI
jgi:hypothetical protein